MKKDAARQAERNVNKQYQVCGRIGSLRRAAEELRDKWLRDNGWKATSSTPGCFWMWRKGEFLCDVDTAERIQNIWCVEAYFKQHPELEGD